MLLIFLYYQHSFPQLAFPEKPRQQATFTPHPAKGTPECTEVSIYDQRDSDASDITGPSLLIRCSRGYLKGLPDAQYYTSLRKSSGYCFFG